MRVKAGVAIAVCPKKWEPKSRFSHAPVLPESCATLLSLRTRVPTLWTNSYFVATVGGAPLAVIKQYIESQKCN